MVGSLYLDVAANLCVYIYFDMYTYMCGRRPQAPTVWMWPRGKKEPPYPIDLTAELPEPRAMVSTFILQDTRLSLFMLS